MSNAISSECASKQCFDLLLCLANILRVELDTDALYPLALGSLRRDPDDPTRHWQSFVPHKIQQYEHFVSKFVSLVCRDEQPAIFNEWHVGDVQCALVLDAKRQDSRSAGLDF